MRKTNSFYLTKGENKEKLIKTKEAIFSTAFGEAEQRLSQVRKDPKYPDILKNLTMEAVGALGGETFRIHIDKQDEKLIKKILSEFICQEKSLLTFNVQGVLLSVHRTNP